MTHKRSKITENELPIEFCCWNIFLKESIPYIFTNGEPSFKIKLESIQLTKQYQPGFDYLEGCLISKIKLTDGTNHSISRSYPFRWEIINKDHTQLNPFRIIEAVSFISTLKKEVTHEQLDTITFSLIAAAQNFMDMSSHKERVYRQAERETLRKNSHIENISHNGTLNTLQAL